MVVKVPPFKEPGLSTFLTDMVKERDRLLATRLSSLTANKSLLLFSPSEKVYEIKVDDAGVITATLVAG